MFRTLLAGQMLFASAKASLVQRVSRAATLAACGLVAIVLLLGALASFAVAGAMALAPHVGTAGAVAIVGAVLALLGLIVLLVGMRIGRPPRKAQPAFSPAAAAAAFAPSPDDRDKGDAAPRPGSGAPALSWLLGAAALGMLLGRRL